MKKVLSIVVLVLAVAVAVAFLYMRAHVAEPAAPTATGGAAAVTPDALPTATPSPTPYDRAEELLAGMTPEEKAWQLLIVRPEALTGAAGAPDAAALAAALAERPAGGLVLSADNLVTAEQTSAFIAGAQAGSRLPLFISVDEEGGLVTRVAQKLGTTDFKPMYTYKDQGAETAYANAATIAGDILPLGFNVDFAPVADIWTNPLNTVIGTRAYSDDPAQAAELVSAAVRGFQENGVIATLKHFPGHGGTAEDSHDGAAYSDRTLQQLRESELLPFAAGIEAGAEMVMVGHITLTAVDPDQPATFSEKLVTRLLRQELGFEGVVVTDGLEMGAITVYDSAEIAVRAIDAGVDILLAPEDADAAVQAILDQVDEARIDESVLRILRLKLKYGILA